MPNTKMDITARERELLIERRVELERAIIRTMVEDAFDMGLLVTHHNGEEVTASVRVISDDEIDGVRGRTKEQAVDAIMEQVQQCDEETITFKEWRGLSKPRRIGNVFLVYGNDGYVVICDYTANDEMEQILAGAIEYSDKAEESQP